MSGDKVAGFDIVLIGRGVRDVAHMTLESLEALKKCKRGFVVSPAQEAVDAFREALLQKVKESESLPPLVSLSAAYQKDRLRLTNYSDAAQAVLDAAKSDPPVAYLTPGNPVIYDTVTHVILKGARASGLRTKVLPSVSFIDTMLVDLEEEPAPGLQIYEASWVVGAQVRPDTRFACMLVQISLFCTNFPVVDRMPETAAMRRLRDHLLKFYPSDHVIVIVRSGSGWSGLPTIQPLALGALDNVRGEIQLGASLYIPPLSIATFDDEFAAMMSSVDNLNALYPERNKSC